MVGFRRNNMNLKFEEIDPDDIVGINEAAERFFVPGTKKARKNIEKDISIKKTKKEQDWH
jgi:hypothetical protein